MPSVLYSTTCFIKNDFYRLRIYVDEPSRCSQTMSRDYSSTMDCLNLTSETIAIHHILPSSTRLHFELLNKNKAKQNIPEAIALNHLLSVQQTNVVRNDHRIRHANIPETDSFGTSSRITTAIRTTALEQSAESSRIMSTPNTSEIGFKSRPSIFRRFFSSSTSSDGDAFPIFKRSIKIQHIDVSNPNKWFIKCLDLEMDSESLADDLYTNLKLCLSVLKHRPQHLLTFINPLSGKGRARSVYEKKVLPLFHAANLSVNSIYTERANHAQEFILNELLDGYDGLICVGGDGMFAELCHGLLLRAARDEQIDIDDRRVNVIRPSLKIGIIPAGSTDAVVFGTTGSNDPITSALQIIIGESLPIDITTVHNEHGFVRFMATMLAYGFFGDIIRQSDQWRCLGPFRYDLAGFFQFIRHASYRSELKITLSSEESSENSGLDTKNSTIELIRASSTASDCQQLISSSTSTLIDTNPIRQKSCGSIDQIAKSDLTFCHRNCNKCTEEEPFNRNKDQALLQIKREGRYKTINCLNMPCRCAKSKYGMSPSVHLGNGTFDLILVKHCWRFGFLRFLWRVARDGRSIENLPDVERYRVQEVLIRPINSGHKGPGHWTCDGELITGNEIQIRVHRQALNLFAAGIQLKEKRRKDFHIRHQTTSCFSCCCCEQDQTTEESNF